MTAHGARFFAALAMAVILAGCNVGTPDISVPDRDQLIGRQDERWEKVPALRRVPVSADLFLSRSLRPPVPAEIGDKRIDLRFPTGNVTLSDFAGIMDLQEVSVVLKPNHGGNPASASGTVTAPVGDLETKRLPFRRFSGTVSDLINKLNRSMDVAAWWEAGALFISDRDQYVVSLPQHKEVIEAVSKELASFGAENITTSLYGGRIVYTARPQLNDNVIKPYFRSLSGNLSEITMQVAVISLTLNEVSERGFDWSSFGLQLGDPDRAKTGDLLSSPVFGSVGGAAGVTGALNATSRPAGSGKISVGIVDKLLGSERNVYGINAAIMYLSQFGKTQTKQMVELRTLAGMPVQLRSGQEVPFVKSIAATTTPGGTTAGNVSNSVQTDTVSTGLTLKLTPYFDSLMELVVIDVSIEVAAVPEFRTLSAGQGLGDISQPVKEERSLNDIVRIKAGETVILGGIREENQSDNRTAPFGLFDQAGSKALSDQTILNFFIMRPVVTFYEPTTPPDPTITDKENTLKEPDEVPVEAPAPAADLTGVLPPVLPLERVTMPPAALALPPVSAPPPQSNVSPVEIQGTGGFSDDDFSGRSNMFGRSPTNPETGVP